MAQRNSPAPPATPSSVALDKGSSESVNNNNTLRGAPAISATAKPKDTEAPRSDITSGLKNISIVDGNKSFSDPSASSSQVLITATLLSKAEKKKLPTDTVPKKQAPNKELAPSLAPVPASALPLHPENPPHAEQTLITATLVSKADKGKQPAVTSLDQEEFLNDGEWEKLLEEMDDSIPSPILSQTGPSHPQASSSNNRQPPPLNANAVEPRNNRKRGRSFDTVDELVERGWKIRKPADNFNWVADTLVTLADNVLPKEEQVDAVVLTKLDDFGLHGYALCLAGVPPHYLDLMVAERHTFQVLTVVPIHLAVVPEAFRIVILFIDARDYQVGLSVNWTIGRIDHPPGYDPTLPDHLYWYRVMFYYHSPHQGDFRRDMAAACAAEDINLLSIANTKNPFFIMGYARILKDFVNALKHIVNGSKIVVTGKNNQVTIITVRKSLCCTNDPRVVILVITNFPPNVRDDALLAKLKHEVNRRQLGDASKVIDAHVYLAYKTNRRTTKAYLWVTDPTLAEKLCVTEPIRMGTFALLIAPAADRNNGNLAELE